MGAKGRGRFGRRSPVWKDDIADAFLAVLRATGNAQAAIRAVGHGNMFYRRKREDPVFARRWAEMASAADRDLRAQRDSARSPFPARAEGPPAAAPGPEPFTLPPPAAKVRSAQPEPVIRRNRGGRLQLALPREGAWTAEIEASFLAHLRECGNFIAAARAVGFHFTTVYERMRQWPGFAEDVAEALREIDVRLEYQLIAHANAVLHHAGEPRPEGEAETPFDPDSAIRILTFLDRRRAGRTGRGPRKGPPERSFEEAVESILAKVEAIERHRELIAKKTDREEGND